MEQRKINFNDPDFKLRLEEAAFAVYNEIMAVPPEIRQDEPGKERTGIWVLAQEPGTRNAVHFKVYLPSMFARICSIEKAVRSYVLGDCSSQNSEDPEKMRFRGSLTVASALVEQYIQVSISGLQSDEDVAISIRLQSFANNLSPKTICATIEAFKGQLPNFINEPDHYLYKIVFK